MWSSSTGGASGVKRSAPDGFTQRPKRMGNDLKISCGLTILEIETNTIIVVNFEDTNIFGGLG